MVGDCAGRALAFVGFDGRPKADSLLTRDEARDIAVNVTRPPEHRSAQLKLKPPLVASASVCNRDRRASHTPPELGASARVAYQH